MLLRRRINHNSTHIWPSFVDVMASVLMVLLFVLMTFVLSQICLTDALNDKDKCVLDLEGKMRELSKLLSKEKLSNKDLSQTIEKFQNEIKNLNALLSILKTGKESAETEISSMLDKLKSLQELYDALDQKTKEEIQKLKEKHAKFDQIERYRSKFFDKLLEIMKNRTDIKIVGDRFVFGSEVLFDTGSSKLNLEGESHLNSLVDALLEISNQIPKEVEWVLRIDGHTDDRPINRNEFKSNWELSSARAISVVKFLISKGIPSNRLVAAGFAEYQPLTDELTQQAKNRRIEFRFDLLR